MSRAVRSKPKPPKKAAAAPEITAREASEIKASLQKKSGIRRKGADEKPVPAAALSAKARTDMKGVVVYLNAAAKTQLAKLAIDADKTVQELGTEAFNLLFRTYGCKEIA